MGVELALVFCYYGRKKAEVFSYLDTHKMLRACYNDLFDLEGIIPEKLDQRFLCKEYMGDISEDGFGSKFQLFSPNAILQVIKKHIHELSKPYEDHHDSDYKDPRVQMAIGMLENLSLNPSSCEVLVGLHWG